MDLTRRKVPTVLRSAGAVLFAAAVATERYQTGGEDPILGVRGRGGPVSSPDFRADPRGYTIDGSSQCIVGDFDRMSLDSQD